MKNLIWALAAGMVVLALSAQEVRADSILDQEYDPSATATGWINNSFPLDRAQTFTVGITGALRSVKVDIKADSATTADLLFDIRTTSSGTPNESDSGSGILFSASIAVSDIGTSFSFFEIDLGSDAFDVTDGDVLAIVLRTNDNTNSAYQWHGTSADGYSGGSATRRISGGTWGTNSVSDFSLKTYVEASTSPAPEPSTIVLLGLGLAGVALRYRKTRRERDSAG